MKKYFVLVSLVMCVSGYYARALTVSFVPSEPEEFLTYSPTVALISGCMDPLFDAGMVVTNSDTNAIDFAQWPQLEVLADAQLAKIDYSIFLYIHWEKTRDIASGRDRIVAHSIDYRIYDVASSNLLAQGTIVPVSKNDTKLEDKSVALDAGFVVGKVCLSMLPKVR